ncbi:unnamed protein product [Caenorhabditis nigoni]
MEGLMKNLQECNVNDEPKKKLGLVPLAPKVDRNPEGTPVTLHTNLRRLNVEPNTPVYKYSVKVLYVFSTADGKEATIEFSNLQETGAKQDRARRYCQRAFTEALQLCPDLRTAGTTYYDRQASLYSLQKLNLKKEIDITVQKKVSSARNFVRAEFKLAAVAETYQATSNDMKKIANACPALADKTFPEALSIFISGPAYANSNVITIDGCVHYLLDISAIGFFKDLYFPEGGLYTALGATKGIKYLEGKDENPSLYMATELKVTLFHPDNVPLPELISQYLGGLDEKLSASSKDGLYISRALKGCEFYLNYSKSTAVSDFEDNLVVKLYGFTNCATNSFFDREGRTVSVADHFREKYNIQLKYPSLMTAVAKPKGGKLMTLPVELLVLCPSQKVTNERMVNNEQSELIRMSAAEPNIRKAATEDVAKAVGIASSNVLGFIGVGQPETVNGIVLAKPKITFADNKVASLNDPSAKIPTDFRRAGNFFQPKSLQKWEICYVECREMPGVPEELVRSMAGNGMSVAKPNVRCIREQEVQKVFQNAQQANYQLIFFIIPQRFNTHAEIKALEQHYDILTQEIHSETAERLSRQAQTRQNIVNKTNMKLGGLNYLISSSPLDIPNTLIIGFETSSRGGAGVGPVSVGFAANMLDHHLKFGGGYIYTERTRDVFGPVIEDAFAQIFATAKQCRNMVKGPQELVIYFNGVSEGQFALINEVYSAKIKKACSAVREDFRPKLTIIASSKNHNERFYKALGNSVGNMEPGTVIDHTLVSPEYSEFYLSSAVARKGTVKSTKFTIVYSSVPEKNLHRIERLTNDLAYDHQIVFQPVGLPVPLFIAGRYSQRGANVLGFRGAVTNKEGVIDYQITNEELGYAKKKLSRTRFNA